MKKSFERNSFFDPLSFTSRILEINDERKKSFEKRVLKEEFCAMHPQRHPALPLPLPYALPLPLSFAFAGFLKDSLHRDSLRILYRDSLRILYRDSLRILCIGIP